MIKSVNKGGYMEQLVLKTSDGEKLSVRVYDAPSCKGVVQLIHGMEEHQARRIP